MKIKKTVIRTSLLLVLISGAIISRVFAGTSIVIPSIDMSGEWDHGTITKREAVLTDNAGAVARITINIASAGKYQLLAYVYHNWRKASPVLYMEATDSKGHVHKGYHVLEKILYLRDETAGRWFFISLADNPYWELPGGELRIRIWAKGLNDPWVKAEVPMEDAVAIDRLFILPVENFSGEKYLSWLVNSETAQGNPEICDYYPAYGTHLIGSRKFADPALFSLDVPYDGHYRLGFSVFASMGSSLKFKLQNKAQGLRQDIVIKASPTWSFAMSDRVYLNRGNYSFTLGSNTKKETLIDYLVLLPDTGQKDQP